MYAQNLWTSLLKTIEISVPYIGFVQSGMYCCPCCLLPSKDLSSYEQSRFCFCFNQKLNNQ